MSVSRPNINRVRVITLLLLTGMVSCVVLAQDTSQPQSAPQAASQPSAPQASGPPQQNPESGANAQQTSPQASTLKPLPQAPAPQRNAHPYSEQDYTHGKHQWPNPFVIYGEREVAPVRVSNSAHVDQILRDGKMYLSINDAITLALENNLDVGIQRYNLSIADTDILRTSSGAVALGVNAGLVQGTPGGTTGTTSAGGTGTSTTGATGGGVGGTQIGVGGAGAGAAGIVASTQGEGPPIDNYDPVITGTVNFQRAIIPESNTIITGTNTLYQNTTNANFLYSQGFSSGTLMTAGFNNTRNSSNALFNTLNPSLTPSFQFELRQHLLQGFGFDPNLRWIRIARNNKMISEVTFRNQIITTVSQIENIYWDLVNAYENVNVQQRALDLANKTLSDNQKQVAAGTLAPLTVVQSQSAVATAKQNLIAAQVALQLQQLLMKNAITRNMADPMLAVAPVIPTDTLSTTTEYEVGSIDDLLAEALKQRPEILTARLNLTNSLVTRKSIRNQLLPTVDLYAFYGASALAGPTNPLCTDPTRCAPPGFPTSYSGAFSNLFNSSSPDKGVGVNINIPLRDRQVQADQVRNDLEYRQAQLSLLQAENTIMLQVRQAQFALQQNWVALQAAISARDYAAQSLDAEQKKLVMGASTSTLVLQASSNMTQAESNVLAAATNYEKSKVQLDLSTAETLARLGIDLTDAQSGKIKHEPNVPGVVPASGPNELTTPHLIQLGPGGPETGPTMAPQPRTPQQPQPQQQNPPPPPQAAPQQMQMEVLPQ
ncbi:MAG TPA: TolC family protein [Terriglobales bacterium]|nr:TolC family protein [Terriglobales bacterium]